MVEKVCDGSKRRSQRHQRWGMYQAILELLTPPRQARRRPRTTQVHEVIDVLWTERKLRA